MKKTLLLIAAIMVAHWASAQWDGTTAPITQGSGTESDPYRINTPQQLAFMSDMVSGGIGSYQSAYYLLTQDISLSNQPWAPIGDDLHPFSGQFDGGGHTVDSVSVSSAYTKRGFFGVVQSGTIQNIILNVNIGNSNTGSNTVAGGVVGSLNNGTIQNCKVYGSVAGYNAGGILGVGSVSTIYGCENYAFITALLHGGGVAASLSWSGVLRCGNHGNIIRYSSSSSDHVSFGGVIGISNNDSIVMCYNHGNIIVSGPFYAVQAGAIGVSGLFAYVGGVCSNGVVNNCYNRGNIDINSTYSGNNHRSSMSIYGITCNTGDGCYNTGQLTISAISSWGSTYPIGLSCGNNNYYLNTVTGDGCGAPRAESNMKSMSFPAMLNVDSTVYVMDQLGINDGYPVFAYQTVYNITTDNASDVTTYTATLNGHYGGTADSAGFIYWQQGGDSVNVLLTSSSTLQHQLTNLQPNTTYGYKLYVKRGGYTVYGDTVTFTTHSLYTVTVATSNAAWGSVIGGGTFAYGDTAVLMAAATGNYRFVQWDDGNTENPRNLVVTQNTNLTAQFGPALYTIIVSSANTAWGSVTGGGTFSYGETTICTAIPEEGYHFTQWNDGNISNPRIVTADSNISLTAMFAANQYTVTVVSNDTVKGTVSGGGTYDYNQQVYIIAIPNSSYAFSQWSDGNTDAYRQITVTQNVSYTAVFTDAYFNITAQSNNDAYGIVIGGGSYSTGSSVTLTAIANPGYHFEQWSDGNTDNPRTITVTGNMTYYAQFAINTYTVNVVSSDVSQGSVTGGGIYAYLANATIQATPTQNHRFVQWNDGNTNNPRTITVTSDSTFTAQFQQIEQYTITVLSDDPQRGSVTGGGTFFVGTQIPISATPAPNNTFSHWSDGSTETYRTITVTSNATYTAFFSPVTFTVNVFSNNDEMGTVSGGGSYEYGSSATVTATPSEGCRFVRWNNGVETNPYTFSVYSDVNLIANFERTTSIGDVFADDYTVVSQNLDLFIYGAEGLDITVCDIMGRTVYSSTRYDGQPIGLPTTGVYLLRIDNRITKKIVLIR